LNNPFKTSTCQGRARQLPPYMCLDTLWSTEVKIVVFCLIKALWGTATDLTPNMAVGAVHSESASKGSVLSSGSGMNSVSSTWSFLGERREELCWPWMLWIDQWAPC